MKLLFDQNLSPRLAALLSDLFPGSVHVQSAGLDRASDEAVWQFALAQGLTIVSKDSDFQERSQLAGTAPNVVWIRRANVSTAEIEAMLRKHTAQIMALGSAGATEFLMIL